MRRRGPDPIGVTIKDVGGGAAGTTSTATVADAALTGSAAASVTATEGATATLTNATFTDANPRRPPADFSATIDWGDGTTTTFDSSAVSYNSGTGIYTVAGSHTYAEEVTGTDNDHRDGQRRRRHRARPSPARRRWRMRR